MNNRCDQANMNVGKQGRGRVGVIAVALGILLSYFWSVIPLSESTTSPHWLGVYAMSCLVFGMGVAGLMDRKSKRAFPILAILLAFAPFAFIGMSLYLLYHS